MPVEGATGWVKETHCLPDASSPGKVKEDGAFLGQGAAAICLRAQGPE